MPPIFTPGRRPALLPGSTKRALRRPDGRGLISPIVSAAPLSPEEVDYDELSIVRSWRAYEDADPGLVRYFCYELEQTNPGEPTARFFKAVRLIRLTRVPRYLRDVPPYEQMRDVLVSLREKRVLFLNLIAKSPQLPLVFAYGVQGTGESLLEAQQQADEAFAALSFCLDGTYQQLEYQPLTLEQGEILARYQAEWAHIAMARGRPMPQGTPVGTSALVDGNRTDVQNTNDAMASFIRGMGDKSFMLSLVAYPLTPEDMTLAWRNISHKLSAVRSDQQGSRGVSAGVALPLGLGTSFAEGNGTTHGLTGSSGVGSSDGLSSGQTLGESLTHTDGVSASQSRTDTDTVSTSVSDSHSTSTSLGQSMTQGQTLQAGESVTAGHSQSVGESANEGVSRSLTQGESLSQSLSHTSTDAASAGRSATSTEGVSVGQSSSMTQGSSFSQSHGVSAGQSLSDSSSASNNWSNSLNKSLTAGQTLADSWSKSMAESLSQTWGLSSGQNDGNSASNGWSTSSGLGGGFPGLSGDMTEGHSGSNGSNAGSSHGQSVSQTGGGTHTNGVGSSLSQSLSQALGLGESFGGSMGRTVTAGSSVGTSDSLTAGQSLASTVGQSVGHSQSLAQGLSSSLSHSEALGRSVGTSQSVSGTEGTSAGRGVSTGVGVNSGMGQSLAHGQSLAQGTTLGQSVSDGRTVGTGQSAAVANGVSQGTNSSDATSVSASATSGASSALSQQQAVSDAWMVAMSRQASNTGSLGVVPSLSATISRQTFDEAKRSLGDLLEAQTQRYHEGIEGGGMLYQMFVVAADRETLVGASALLKDAFWGPGKDSARLPQPFHTVMIEDEDEARRLLTHAAAFTHYRKREPVADLIEPHVYSSYVTAGEASAMSHPPTSEAVGLLAQHDSMPVLAMPADRGKRDMYLGRIVNGERGRVDEARFGVDLDELVHILIQGTTGSGKTTTMMRLLERAVRLEKTIVTTPTPSSPHVSTRTARAGVLCFDWMQNMRDLAGIVEPERFRLFSVSNPRMGAFRWNPLAIPHESMDPGQWLGAQADNLASSFGLGEYGRSLIVEYIDQLYTANRLEDFQLMPQVAEPGTGTVLRAEVVLPALDRATLPAGAVRTDGNGNAYANVYTCPELSRTVSLVDVAALVCAKIEFLATPEGAKLGIAVRDRIQSLWRRINYYAPNGPMAAMVAGDPDLTTRECLNVHDLIDPEKGLVTVIETDGLDLENRRVILGSVMLAVYRYGLHVGPGCFSQGDQGPGTFLVLEEAHELFGAAGEGEDRSSAAMRATLYESMFRRARMTGLRLVAMTQNCGALPSAVTSQTTTVFIHRTYDDEDRKRVFSLLNWSNMIGQQLREWRYLGEMPRGYCIARLDARESYLESAPVQLLVDPPGLPRVSDAQLESMAAARQV